MAIPHRGHTSDATYFVTASTAGKRALLQSQRTAGLFTEVLLHYRTEKKYSLHEFVIMPNHFHLLITPAGDVTLERAVQLVKGGFSYRAKRELGLIGEIWQTSFYDHRVRDFEEFARFRNYIHQNPVKRRLALAPEEFPFSSAQLRLDEVPQRLKPLACAAGNSQG
jgi:putative transposase